MGAEREKISVVFCARVKVVLNVVKTDGNLIVKMRTESWGCECGWTRERERERGVKTAVRCCHNNVS